MRSLTRLLSGRPSWPAAAGLAIATVVLGGQARADTFAAFSDGAGATNTVVVSNGSSPYTTKQTITTTHDLVSFSFQGDSLLAGLPLALRGTLSAYLDYTITTTGAAYGMAGNDYEPILSSFTMAFTLKTPYTPPHSSVSEDNLLTVSFSADPGAGTDGYAALFSGQVGGQGVNLSASASTGLSLVSFASDFLDFTGATDETASLAYTMASREYLGIGSKFLTAYDKPSGGTASSPNCPATPVSSSYQTSHPVCVYRGFTAGQSGNFGATPLPNAVDMPEPAGAAVVAAGLLSLLALRRRRPA